MDTPITPQNSPDEYTNVTRKGDVLVDEAGNEYKIPFWYAIKDGESGCVANAFLNTGGTTN